jgi:hypothetical protein
MHRRILEMSRVAAWCLGMVLVFGCSDAHTEASNGQTHWLRECNDDSDCGNLSCICGLCSATCEHGDTCKKAVGQTTSCVAAGKLAPANQCSTRTANTRVCAAECEHDADCTTYDANLRCASGLCSAVAVGVSNSDPPVASDMDSGAESDAAFDGATGGGGASGGGAGGDEDPPPEAIDGGGKPTPTYADNEAACNDGEPSHLPDGVTLIASDVDMWTWAVSRGTLTWAETKKHFDQEPWILHRQSLADGSSTSVEGEAGFLVSGLAADGGNAVVDKRNPNESDSPHVLQLFPKNGSPLNVALTQTQRLSSLALEVDAVYWASTSADQVLAFWRSPRVPGESVSLGELPFSTTGTGDRNPTFEGVVVIGNWVYAAMNRDDRGQIVRASKDGSAALAAFGPELTWISSLATDGTDLFALIEAETDALANPIVPPRIVRITPDGTTTNVVALENVGDVLAVNDGKVYWREDAHSSDEGSTLWAAAADGSDEPSRALVTPSNGSLGARMFSHQHDLYFVLRCSIKVDKAFYPRPHVLRLRP